MKNAILIAAMAALTLACAKPSLAPPPATPLKVTVAFTEQRPDREALEHRWAEALRDRLAHLGAVRPGGAQGEATDAELKVEVKAVAPRGDMVKHAAGDAFVGSVAGGVDLIGDGAASPSEVLFGGALGALVGVVAAPVAVVGTEGRALYHNARLGYKPRHLICKVTFWKDSGPGVIILETNGWDVIKAMRPMTEAEAKVPGAVQREEAEALATVVVEQLEKVHHWPRIPRAPEPTSAQP
ncbi:MAG TPA: hypothetical protein VJ505_03680 [Holophagaceae bacterium]|nr:hypothetical protein [Holophagaceae bacterium]